ncbi:caprin-2 isoform X2 [Electrophorus electricus]|uniref:caprin-2 isoform X2 n=1 Tax=Electrophorus electricus TaxID=8005 RepID=UPI0015CFCFFC|nr:caprin-2 isoform X2 [Electrophorus electricus]
MGLSHSTHCLIQTMVQLPLSQTSDVTTPPELLKGRDAERDGSPKSDSLNDFTGLQFALNPSAATYHGYDTYIEDGLICLRHKIRNIEKKKLKLEGYKQRIQNGDPLNQDQMDAVARYDEVVHNLKFAKDLQKTLCALTQDLLRAQKAAARREQTLRVVEEQRRLSTVLQVQYVLRSLQRDDVRRHFCDAREHTRFLSTEEVENLLDLASLLGCVRDESMSLEAQMEQASFVYLDLLEGKDEPVAGSTYKRLKERLLRLVDCGFFDRIPTPQADPKRGGDEAVASPVPRSLSGEAFYAGEPLRPTYSGPEVCGLAAACVTRSSLSALVSLKPKEVPSQKFLNRRYPPEADLTGHGQEENDDLPPVNWKAEFLALKEREPPDSWDMEVTETSASSQSGVHKPWKGAAGFIPKTPLAVKRPGAEPKQKRQRKDKGSQDSKSGAETLVGVELLDSPSSLAQDPVLRRQQLDHLLDQISGSFTFMQDSLLDGAVSPSNGCSRRLLPPSAAPLAQREQKSPSDLLPQTLHSTPLHGHLLPGDSKGSLANGEPSLDGSGAELHAGDTQKAKQDEGFPSPHLYRRKPSISVPLENHSSDQVASRALCNGVASPPARAPVFSTPPSRRTLAATSSAPFNSIRSVFSGEPPMTASLDTKSDEDGFQRSVCLSYSAAGTLSYSTASTQTPPELSLPQDDVQMESAYLSESETSAGCLVYSSPALSTGPRSQGRLGQPYYSRGPVRGTARGGRGLSHSYRSPGASRGCYDAQRVSVRAPAGSYMAHAHREPGTMLFPSQENGYQLSHKRAGGGAAAQRISSTGWSDSSQVSSPDREGTYLADSGHGDSLSSPAEVPVGGTPPLVHVYPVAQQLRVAFSAARTANFAPGTLDQPVSFDLLQSNLGGVFDMPSGRFSCPAPGTYVFFFHMLKLAISVPLYVNLMRNDEVMVSAYANDGAPDHETASNHAVLQLYHGDQVWLRLHRGAIYGSSWKYSTFSGFLLYQD